MGARGEPAQRLPQGHDLHVLLSGPSLHARRVRGQLSHYFDARPRAASQPSTVEVDLPRVGAARFTTDAGVFSATRLDPGTRVLLELAPAPPSTGVVVDLGCGWGAIAVWLARQAPDADVVAVDVNERARELTASNAATAGVDNVRVCAPEEIGDVVVDALYSNPPVRVGKAELHDLLTTWLARLSADGAAWLVVQRHLGSDSLADWLQREGWRVRKVGSRRGYRVLEVRG